MVAFLGICLMSYCQSYEIIDNAIYGAIAKVIQVRYPQKSLEERECIVDTFRNDRIADNFGSELVFDHRRLEREMEVYLSKIETKCEWIVFAKSPLGICILVGLIIMIISVCCGLIKCICC